MDLLQRLIDFVFDRVFVQLTKALFLGLLMLPGFAAVLVNLTNSQPDNANHPILWFLVSRLDSGFQLGQGSFFLRGWLLLLTGLVILIGVQVPRAGRRMWVLSWVFQLLATLSAVLCSHPFEALMTVADMALLNVVVLVAYTLKPRSWVPGALSVTVVMVTLLSLDSYNTQFDLLEDVRLNGTFHQPNIMATFLAGSLPWIINQYLGDWRRPKLQLGAFLGLLFLLTALLLTASRAAWVVAALSLCLRWWLGGYLAGTGGSTILNGAGPGGIGAVATAAVPLAPQPLRWSHLARSVMACAALLVTFWLGISSWVAFAVGFLLLAVAAFRSGLRGRSLVLLALAALLAYGVFAKVMASKAQNQATFSTRVSGLQQGTDTSLLARLEFWRSSLLMGIDHPLLGVGPRGFHRYYPSYQIDQRWFAKYAHSAVLSCWAELGVPGTLVLGALVLAWLSAVARGLGRAEEEPGDISRLLDAATSCLIFTLCFAVDVQWQFPALPVIWAAWLGLSLAFAWPDETAVPPPVAVAPVSPWTLRPRVIFSYFLIALTAMASALNLSWAFAQYYSDLAEELLRHGKVADALNCDDRSVRLNPFQASYYHHLGLSYTAALAQKSPPVKLQDYLRVAQRAVALDSHRAVHYDLLAKAYRANQQPKEAREALHRALECDPVNYPSFYTSLAELAQGPAEKSQRERLLLVCLQRFPPDSLDQMFPFRSADITRQMADCYMLLADVVDPRAHPEIAKGYYDQLLKLQPTDLPGQMGRLVCLINMNQLKQAHLEALKLYREAPRDETLDILKHVYQFENLPFDPTGLPPIPGADAPTPTPTPSVQLK